VQNFTITSTNWKDYQTLHTFHCCLGKHMHNTDMIFQALQYTCSCSCVMWIHAVWHQDWQSSQQMLRLSLQFWRQSLQGQGWPSKRIFLLRCMTT